MRNLFKKFRRKLVVFSFIFVLTLLLCAQTTSAASFRTASAYRTYKSIVGLKVFTIGVRGDYKVSKKKIVNWTNARAVNSTHYIGWSCKKKSAKWVHKGAKSSKLRNNSHFYYGLNTQWVKLNIQSYDIELNKTVKP